MAKTFKPIHSRNRDVLPGLKNQNSRESISTRVSNDNYQSLKHQEHPPQKLNRVWNSRVSSFLNFV